MEQLIEFLVRHDPDYEGALDQDSYTTGDIDKIRDVIGQEIPAVWMRFIEAGLRRSPMLKSFECGYSPSQWLIFNGHHELAPRRYFPVLHYTPPVEPIPSPYSHSSEYFFLDLERPYGEDDFEVVMFHPNGDSKCIKPDRAFISFREMLYSEAAQYIRERLPHRAGFLGDSSGEGRLAPSVGSIVSVFEQCGLSRLMETRSKLVYEGYEGVASIVPEHQSPNLVNVRIGFKTHRSFVHCCEALHAIHLELLSSTER